MIQKKLKEKIHQSMKNKNQAVLDVCRVALGDIQTLESRKGSVSEDECQKILRKLVDSNNEMMRSLIDEMKIAKLKKENEVLDSLLPKLLSVDEIEAIFLNSDGAEFEKIRDVENVGQAMGIAMKFLSSKKLSINGNDVKEVVSKIRSL